MSQNHRHPQNNRNRRPRFRVQKSKKKSSSETDENETLLSNQLSPRISNRFPYSYVDYYSPFGMDYEYGPRYRMPVHHRQGMYVLSMKEGTMFKEGCRLVTSGVQCSCHIDPCQTKHQPTWFHA